MHVYFCFQKNSVTFISVTLQEYEKQPLCCFMSRLVNSVPWHIHFCRSNFCLFIYWIKHINTYITTFCVVSLSSSCWNQWQWKYILSTLLHVIPSFYFYITECTIDFARIFSINEKPKAHKNPTQYFINSRRTSCLQMQQIFWKKTEE